MGGTGKIKKFLFISIMLGVALMTSGFDFFNDFWDKLTPHSNEYGKFERVGDMHYARSGHKAVLLQDGRVLIHGGAKARAEIYDPKNRKFKLISKPQKSYNGDTLTLLNNGQVLITGLAEHADLFDPEKEEFISTGKMNYLRVNSTATLLKDRKVLITGGRIIDPNKSMVHQGWNFAEFSEIYNPETGKFEIGPKINVPRYKHGAILLNDGNVLIVGGEDNRERFSSAEIYNINVNIFTLINDMNSIRVKPQLIKLEDGKVLIISGYANITKVNKNCTKNTCGWQREIEIYDPENKKFSKFIENDLTAPTSRATLLKNGNILFTGGDVEYRWYFVNTDDSAILDTKTKKFAVGPKLTKKRGGGTTTLLKDGAVLLISGKTPELYVPNNK